MRPDRLRTAIGHLLKPGIAVDVRPVDAGVESPFSQERAAMARAVPSRKAEFFSGRLAARTALKALGGQPQAIPQSPDRAPVWPAGVIGSISHSDGLAAAIVGQSPPYRSLGLDIETGTDLDPGLWCDILTKQDLTWLQTRPEPHRGPLAKQLFSIKECAFKAQFPLSKALLEFSAFTVDLAPQSGLFKASFQHPVPPFQAGDSLHGKSIVQEGLILSVICQ